MSENCHIMIWNWQLLNSAKPQNLLAPFNYSYTDYIHEKLKYI